jgi:hypothetical protein
MNLNTLAVALPTGQTITIDIGRTLAITILGVAALAGAGILWALDEGTGAAWFAGIGEALVFSGLGIVQGKKSGAEEVAAKMPAGMAPVPQ